MNYKLKKVVCGLCGKNNFKTKYVVDGFNYVQCQECGFVYVNPRLAKEEITQLYNEDYFTGNGFDKSVEYRKEFEQQSWQIDLNDWDISSINYFLGKKSESKNLLDIGCGMGLFLWKAKKKGFNVEGLELSDFAAQFVKSNGIKVQQKSIDDAELQNNYFDAIVMKEVIEHLPDVKSSLNKIYSAMKKNGVLFLTTGNYNCPERKLRGSNWFYFMPTGHLQVFSHQSIKNILIQTGFRKVIVTRQGDLLMNFLLRNKILDTSNYKPNNFLKRVLFELIRFINQFISSGMRVYAIK
ncbi:MAG: class I SAM-dependent methyltransferase [Ignavibacteriales bacterium]